MAMTHNIPRKIISDKKNQKSNKIFNSYVMLFPLLFTTISAMGKKCQRHVNSFTVCSDGSKQQMPIVARKSLNTYCLYFYIYKKSEILHK